MGTFADRLLGCPSVELLCPPVPRNDVVHRIADQNGIVSQANELVLLAQTFSDVCAFLFSKALDRHIADSAYHMQGLLDQDGPQANIDGKFAAIFALT